MSPNPNPYGAGEGASDPRGTERAGESSPPPIRPFAIGLQLVCDRSERERLGDPIIMDPSGQPVAYR